MKVFIDTMNILFMAYHVTRKQLHDQDEMLTDDNFGFYYHMLMNKLHPIFAQYKAPIFCWEGNNSLGYRRSLFPDYKNNRAQAKAEDEYIVMKNHFEEIKELLSLYPSKHIAVDGAEADDVIYALCDKYQDEDIIVMSSDGDLAQLINYFPNVSVVNPIFKKSAKVNPNLVEEKAVCGDKSDNIPGLYRVGPKTFEKMLADKSEWNKVMSKGNNQEIYEIFKKIVDLRAYPKEIQEAIKKTEEETPVNEFNPGKIQMFYWDNKMNALLNKWSQYQGEIYMVNGGTQKVDTNILKSDNEEQPDVEKTAEEQEIDDILGEFV